MKAEGPKITVIQDWPKRMTIAVASEYMGVSVAHFTAISRLYPGKLRTFNLLPGGEVSIDREDIDVFIEWRKEVGFEAKTG